MRNGRKLSWLLFFAAGMAGWSPVHATSCTVQSAGVAFGAYDPLAASPVDGVGTVRIDCDVQTSLTVALGQGSGSSGTRQMTNGSSQLLYNLYTDASRTFVWGDGVSGSDVSVSGTTINLPVYGRIFARQNVIEGQYADTIVITVSY